MESLGTNSNEFDKCRPTDKDYPKRACRREGTSRGAARVEAIGAGAGAEGGAGAGAGGRALGLGAGADAPGIRQGIGTAAEPVGAEGVGAEESCSG